VRLGESLKPSATSDDIKKTTARPGLADPTTIEHGGPGDGFVVLFHIFTLTISLIMYFAAVSDEIKQAIELTIASNRYMGCDPARF